MCRTVVLKFVNASSGSRDKSNPTNSGLPHFEVEIRAADRDTGDFSHLNPHRKMQANGVNNARTTYIDAPVPFRSPAHWRRAMTAEGTGVQPSGAFEP